MTHYCFAQHEGTKLRTMWWWHH